MAKDGNTLINALAEALKLQQAHYEWLIEHDQHRDADLVMVEIVRAALAKFYTFKRP